MAKYLAPSERFSNFDLETEIRGTPRGAPGGPKIKKKIFSKNLIFLVEMVSTMSITVEMSTR